MLMYRGCSAPTAQRAAVVESDREAFQRQSMHRHCLLMAGLTDMMADRSVVIESTQDQCMPEES